MDTENGQKINDENKAENHHVAEDVIHHHHHQADDMPSSYRGRGPQENMSIGYDALEDI